MQKDPDCVTVEVIPLGLASVDPHIPLPIACARGTLRTLNPLTINKNESSP